MIGMVRPSGPRDRKPPLGRIGLASRKNETSVPASGPGFVDQVLLCQRGDDGALRVAEDVELRRPADRRILGRRRVSGRPHCTSIAVPRTQLFRFARPAVDGRVECLEAEYREELLGSR